MAVLAMKYWYLTINYVTIAFSKMSHNPTYKIKYLFIIKYMGNNHKSTERSNVKIKKRVKIYGFIQNNKKIKKIINKLNVKIVIIILMNNQ